MHQAGCAGLEYCSIKHLDVAYNAFAGNAADVLDKYRGLALEVCLLQRASPCPVLPFPPPFPQLQGLECGAQAVVLNTFGLCTFCMEISFTHYKSPF